MVWTSGTRMGRSAILAALAVLAVSWLVSVPLSAESPGLAGDGPWVVRVPPGDLSTMAELEKRFDVWRLETEKGFAWVGIDRAEAVELANLLAEKGLVFTVDARQSELLGRATVALRDGAKGTGGGIPGFSCYRTVDETHARAAQLAVEYPELAEWIDIGDSWEKLQKLGGDDLMVLRLGRSGPGPKPRVFVNTAIHAREYTTAELGLRFAEYLLARYDQDADVTWLLDEHELHFNLQANPDGRRRAETGLSWRKNANNDHCSNTNDRGVDLNRNFDFAWGCCGGSSGSPCSISFRGPSAGSEPEIIAIQDYVRGLFPDQRPDDLEIPTASDATGLLLDIHSFGEDVLWSYGFRDAPPPEPNGSQLYTLGRKYAFFTDYRPQHGSLGTVDGSTKDFAYGELGVPGYTIELGGSFFEPCGAFEHRIWPDNLRALLYAAKIVRTPYQTPAGPDAIELVVSPHPVDVGAVATIEAVIDDTRYGTANGIEPSQAIAGADLYVGSPPWAAEGVAITMAASDGTFDETVEAVTTSLDTTTLGVGRHTLFVQGRDADGNLGAVSAVFLHVIDPAVAPTLSGVVRDSETQAPLEAVVSLGSFATASDPATGAYQFQVPSGSYTLTVEAEGHASGSQEVSLVDFEAAVRNVFLAPWVERFADDVEQGAVGWTAQAPWAISDETAASPTRAWSDSPGGNYPNNAGHTLSSPEVDLSALENVELVFQQTHDFEPGFDFGIVEVWDGASWQEVLSVGAQAPWGPVVLAVPRLDGVADARIRFRVSSDGSVTTDGWHLDDIVLRGVTPPAPPIFVDGFESGDTGAWSSVAP